MYWVCPPVDLVAQTFQHLEKQEDVKAVMAFPEWKSSNFWSILVKNGELPRCVTEFLSFNPTYFPTGRKVNQIFSGRKNLTL